MDPMNTTLNDLIVLAKAHQALTISAGLGLLATLPAGILLIPPIALKAIQFANSFPLGRAIMIWLKPALLEAAKGLQKDVETIPDAAPATPPAAPTPPAVPAPAPEPPPTRPS